jgi:oxygen-dependent protoporphyrinogen oxidase
MRCTAWPAAIPQYNLGYGPYLELFSSLEKRFAGLHFGGNARDGISVPNCISSGAKLAATQH